MESKSQDPAVIIVQLEKFCRERQHIRIVRHTEDGELLTRCLCGEVSYE